LPNLFNLILFRALAKVFSIRSVAVDGDYGTFYGSPMDMGVLGQYLMTQKYAPKIVNYILDTFDGKEGGTFIDIGANIGFTMVPVAKAGITCIAFEPDPGNFGYLQRNVQESGVAGKVTLYNTALYDRSCQLLFEISDWNHGDHRIRKDERNIDGVIGEKHRKVITVNAEKLDDMISSDALQRPIVIKIDTEGAEVNIFRGGEDVISRADLVIFEYCPYMMRRLDADDAEQGRFAEKHFKSGFALGKHNKDADIVLGSITDTVSFLKAFSDRASPMDYLDVFLSK
jgi:FkbM family methyltransferase